MDSKSRILTAIADKVYTIGFLDLTSGPMVLETPPGFSAASTTADLNLRLVALPAYRPDFNADEAIWDWAREEVAANASFGTAAKVREKLDAFFAGLAERAAKVPKRCRTVLQAQADALMAAAHQLFTQTHHVDLTLALV